MRRACGLGGVDRCAVLGDAAADGVGRDQQQPLDAGERVGERLRLVEVARADLRAALGEVGELGRVARHQHEVGGGDAALERELGGAAAEAAGGAGDGESGH